MGSDSRRSRHPAPTQSGEGGVPKLVLLRRAPLSTIVPLVLAALWTLFCVIVAAVGGVSGGMLILLWLAGVCLPLGAATADVLMNRAESRRPAPTPEPEPAPRREPDASEPPRTRSASGGSRRRRRRTAPGPNPGGG